MKQLQTLCCPFLRATMYILMCFSVLLQVAESKDLARDIGHFVDIESGITHKSSLYELLVREPEDENTEHLVKDTVDGDEILTSEQRDFFHLNQRQARKIVTNPRMLWPGAIIPWKFDNKKRKFERAGSYIAVKEAISHWERHSCLQFVQRGTAQYDRLRNKHAILSFGTGNGCASPVGYRPGLQEMFLNEDTCMQIGTIVHEIGHAIGFFHEQARADRDNHVTIHKDNIKDGLHGNFLVTGNLANFADYDLGSIMHYGSKFFSRNGLDTILPKNSLLYFLLGQREALSFYDVQEVNKAYDCAVNCKMSLPCHNGGFLLKTCQCYCPLGLSGRRCEDVDPRYSAENGSVITLGYSQVHTLQYTSEGRHTKTVWLIKSPVGTVLALLLNLDLARDPSTHICHHWIEVRFNLIGQEGPRFCGSSRLPYAMYSSGNSVLLMLNTMDTSQVPGEGFRLIFTSQPISTKITCQLNKESMATCPLIQSSVDDLDWVLSSSYIYLPLSNKYFGRKARLFTPEIKEGTWCLQLTFYVRGDPELDHLRLLAVTRAGQWRLWDSFSIRSRDWSSVSVTIRSKHQFKVVVEGHVYKQNRTVLRCWTLDPSECPHPNRSVDCSFSYGKRPIFECGFERDWCGFGQDHKSTLELNRQQVFQRHASLERLTKTNAYFLSRIAVNQVGKGTEKRDERSTSDPWIFQTGTGFIVSPTLKSPGGWICVRFSLYVWGLFPGTLTLYVVPSMDEGRRKIVWRSQFLGVDWTRWSQINVPVNTPTAFKVAFEVTMPSWFGNLALDEISVAGEPC